MQCYGAHCEKQSICVSTKHGCGLLASWCGARSIDPISCPIGDVVNFLAEMFSDRYQYRSLNAYRSAISSVDNDINETGHNCLEAMQYRIH